MLSDANLKDLFFVQTILFFATYLIQAPQTSTHTHIFQMNALQNLLHLLVFFTLNRFFYLFLLIQIILSFQIHLNYKLLL